MELLCLVLLRLILLGIVEVLIARTSSIFDQHLILDGLPSVESFPDPPSDCLEGGNVGIIFKDHHRKDN